LGKIEKGRIKFDTEAAFGYLKGQCKWAELLAVGMYGHYSIKMYGDAVEDMKVELDAMQSSAYDEVIELGKKAEKANLYKYEEDDTAYLGFKLKEEKFDGTPNEITFYDAGGAKVPDWDKLVGNGSTVKIKYRIAPYYMASTKMVGISYTFYAVQVIDLKEFTQGDSGFGDETSDSKAPFDEESSEDF